MSCISRLCLLLGFVFINILATAQGGGPPPSFDFKPTDDFLAKMGEVLPNASNTAAIERFGGVDIALNTGVVKKSIALRPFVFRNIKVPVSMGFSSMGLRVNDRPSNVGMGWNIVKGGIISRVVYGKDDLESTWYPPGFSISPNEDDPATTTYCYKVLNEGSQDNMPDIFSYTIDGYSGKFFIKIVNNERVVQPILATNIQIIYNEDSQTADEWNFKAILPDGTIYLFGGDDAIESSKMLGTQHYLDFVTNAWHVKTITDPHGYAVHFEYELFSDDLILSSIDQTMVDNDPGCNSNSCGNAACMNNDNTERYMAVRVPLLTEINDDDGGKLEIDYSTTGYPEKIITEMRYYDDATTLHSKYSFTYQTVTPTGGTALPFLTNIKEKDAQGNALSAGYTFSYYNLSSVPKRFSYAQDHWGFFNNAINSTLIPTPDDPVEAAKFPYATADREPDPAYAIAGLLHEITYPTGGKDAIEYEANTVTSGEDQNGYVSYTKTVIGTSDNSYNNSSTQSFSIGYDHLIKLNITCQYSQPNTPAPHPGGKVFIKNASTNQTVQEIFVAPPPSGTNTQELFLYLDPANYYFYVASQGVYVQTSCTLTIRDGLTPSVTQTQKAIGGLRVKKVTTSDNSGGPDMVKRYYYGTLENKDVSSAQFYETPEYDAPLTFIMHGNSSGVACSFDCYAVYHHNVLHSNSQRNLYSSEGNLVEYASVIESIGGDNFESGAVEHKYHLVDDYAAYNIRGDFTYLLAPKTNHSIYALGETETNTYKKTTAGLVRMHSSQFENYMDTRWFYDLPFYYVSQLQDPLCRNTNTNEEIIGPEGAHAVFNMAKYYITCAWKYLKSQTDLVYDDNGANPVTTHIDYIYDDPVHFTLTERKFTNSKGEVFTEHFTHPADYPSTSPYPDMLSRNIVEPVIEQTSSLTQGVTTKELSKIKSNYPATAYTGLNSATFYAPSYIEKSFKANTLETELTINAYDSYGNILQTTDKKGIHTAYLWGYNSLYPIAKVIGKTSTELATAISSYSVNTTVTNDPASTDDEMRTELNKLRAMTGCFISTYTYKYKAGMSSETDPNGFSKFYEYDQFDRLVMIRDQDYKILKKICYNYNGQVEDCTSPTVYGNQVQSSNFTKNDCALCETGSQVTYTVPEDKYVSTVDQATANQMALDDITANGQAYANAHGTCTAISNPVTITYQNIAAIAGFTVTYYNATLGTYVFTVPSSGSGNLGCVPSGKYSITIAKTPEGIPPLLLFGSGCQYQSGTFSASFSNVSVGLCHNISIDWDL